jgi:hypothetical protein
MATDDSNAVRRLRAEVARTRPRQRIRPAHPTAVEALIEPPEVVAGGERCGHEGWRWVTLFTRVSNPSVAVPVFCVLPEGHRGQHVSRPRFALFRRGRKYVYVWEDGP